jgi:dihydropyrimidine dehydrogenase (NAD+) subunit PreA
MASLECSFLGVKSPNPFWLASAPPTDKKLNVVRAFEAGWGGVVWKTLGDQIKNTSSRLASIDFNSTRMIGLNNIELITDRPFELNLKEIRETLREWPDRAIFVSLMACTNRESWHEYVKRTQDTGCHGLELNFGCPHGMVERGMGAAVGQDPEIAKMVVEWVMEVAEIPVITKLTPNVASMVPTARAVIEAGSQGLSLINTVQSLMGVDIDNFVPLPNVAGMTTFGGYCGPAIKPIALKFITTLMQDEKTKNIPISGIGGIATWKDAVEFMLLGARNVQVCTAVMKSGFRIVSDLCSGLSNWMDEKGFKSIDEFVGISIPKVTVWEKLDLNYQVIANINQDKCIHCGLCYISCEDTAHQSISLEYGDPYNTYKIIQEECVGCNLCKLVCPVQDCITMVEERRGEPINWPEYQRQGLPLLDH